jgi:hypothetical protein
MRCVFWQNSNLTPEQILYCAITKSLINRRKLSDRAIVNLHPLKGNYVNQTVKITIVMCNYSVKSNLLDWTTRLSTGNDS